MGNETVEDRIRSALKELTIGEKIQLLRVLRTAQEIEYNSKPAASSLGTNQK